MYVVFSGRLNILVFPFFRLNLHLFGHFNSWVILLLALEDVKYNKTTFRAKKTLLDAKYKLNMIVATCDQSYKTFYAFGQIYKPVVKCDNML